MFNVQCTHSLQNSQSTLICEHLYVEMNSTCLLITIAPFSSWSGATIIVSWLTGPNSVTERASDYQCLGRFQDTVFAAKLAEWEVKWIKIRTKATGIPFREFPGIVMSWISGGNSREFLKFRRELRGIHRSLVFLKFFVADYDIFSAAQHAYCLFLSKIFSSVTSLA